MRIGAQPSNDAHGNSTNEVHAQKFAHPKDLQDVQDLLNQFRLLCRVLRTLGRMSSCRQNICLSPSFIATRMSCVVLQFPSYVAGQLEDALLYSNGLHADQPVVPRAPKMSITLWL